jgi:hypothetical protein
MQDIRERNLKISFSNWVTLTFAIGIGVLFLAAEFLQYNPLSNYNENSSQNPIASDFLSNVTSIHLKNRIVDVKFVQKSRNDWMITEPKSIPGSFEKINGILTSLASLKVNKIHQLEPLNQATFALDKPLAIVELESKLQEKMTVKLGLVNPINDSTYIEIPERNAIYQVSNFGLDISSLNFIDIIDARIFRYELNMLSDIEIYERRNSRPFINFKNNNGYWDTPKYNTISQANTVKTLKELLNMKAFMILDQLDEEALKVVKKYERSLSWRVKIKEQSSQEEVEYKLSTYVKAIPGVKFDKRQYVLVFASNKDFPYLVHKDNLNSIMIKYSDLKE